MADISITDRAAIEELVHLHAWYADHGEEPRMADLYTEEGRLVGAEALPIVGRDAIAAWGASRQGIGRTVRHVMSNLLLLPDDGGVSGEMILTLYRHDGESRGAALPLLVADIRDRYVRTPEGWRIEQRAITPVFMAPR